MGGGDACVARRCPSHELCTLVKSGQHNVSTPSSFAIANRTFRLRRRRAGDASVPFHPHHPSLLIARFVCICDEVGDASVPTTNHHPPPPLQRYGSCVFRFHSL